MPQEKEEKKKRKEKDNVFRVIILSKIVTNDSLGQAEIRMESRGKSSFKLIKKKSIKECQLGIH
jgi:hypothetical protein